MSTTEFQIIRLWLDFMMSQLYRRNIVLSGIPSFLVSSVSANLGGLLPDCHLLHFDQESCDYPMLSVYTVIQN